MQTDRHRMTTQTEIRHAFWSSHTEFQELRRTSRRQNEYPADVRSAFVEYVDMLARDGSISESLASRVTL